MATPEEEALQRAKANALIRIVSHLSGVGAPVKQTYPNIEVDSWSLQNAEAAAVVAAGQSEILTMTEAQLQAIAPFIIKVCNAHYGEPETNLQRAQRLWAKAVSVKGNADVWLPIAAFVNGVRARASDRLDDATTYAHIDEIEAEVAGEVGAFRAAYLPLII